MQNTEHTSQNQVSRSNASVQNGGTVGFASVPPVSLKAAETEEQKAEPVQLQKAHQFSTGGDPVAPPKPNNTGLPDTLKSGMESLSGYSLDDVSVHYNSSRPAQLQAHAFAQGTDIHIAPGQEKHLAHEAWHVVQQKQNRVRPTTQLKNVSVNDDAGLEHEADVMGAKAMSVSQPFQLKKLQQGSAGTTVQGKWVDLSKIGQEQKLVVKRMQKESPIMAFIKMLQFIYNSGDTSYESEYNIVTEINWTDEACKAGNQALANTMGDEDYYFADFLYGLVEDGLPKEIAGDDSQPVENGLDVEQDDSDHGTETQGEGEEVGIDWSEILDFNILTQSVDPNGESVLFHIFENLAWYHYQKAGRMNMDGVNLKKAYDQWVNGVFTRGRFKKLIGLDGDLGDNSTDIVQRARTGNTYSHNTNYTGASNGFVYKNVIYYRDNDGNIDFSVKPQSIRTRYNNAEGENLKAAEIKWKNPIKSGSTINMNKALKGGHYGVMPNGKKVLLSKASRTQHFAIADAMYKNQRAGTWTWHHLTPRYQMILVDMRVHAKHGHNGGVYLWS